MASSFDRNVIAKVRRRTGATDSNRVSNRELEEELERGKRVISDEVQEKLNNGNTLNFNDGAATAALENYMFLQVAGTVRSEKARGRGAPAHAGVPRSPSRIRRTDFEDPDMNYWRDELLRSIRDI